MGNRPDSPNEQEQAPEGLALPEQVNCLGVLIREHFEAASLTIPVKTGEHVLQWGDEGLELTPPNGADKWRYSVEGGTVTGQSLKHGKWGQAQELNADQQAELQANIQTVLSQIETKARARKAELDAPSEEEKKETDPEKKARLREKRIKELPEDAKNELTRLSTLLDAIRVFHIKRPVRRNMVRLMEVHLPDGSTKMEPVIPRLKWGEVPERQADQAPEAPPSTENNSEGGQRRGKEPPVESWVEGLGKRLRDALSWVRGNDPKK